MTSRMAKAMVTRIRRVRTTPMVATTIARVRVTTRSRMAHPSPRS